MRYLLDVNVLLAAIWVEHSRHSEAFAWIEGKELAICPLSELGFLRISTQTRAINASVSNAKILLQRFLNERQVSRIDDDIPGLGVEFQSSEQLTDHYLADLAAKHSIRLATFDESIDHENVELIG